MTADRTKVLYIASSARSGSTILNRTLALDGFFAIGELCYIWERGLINNELCGCGAPLRSCEFWTSVMDKAFGGINNVDAHAMARLDRQVSRMRFVAQLALPALRTRKFQSRLSEYCGILEKLYQAIQEVSGARVIVDSSKIPSLAYILNTIPSINLSILHLVRDSRAVCYSWTRKKLRPEVTKEVTFTTQYGPFAGSYYWSVTNTLFEPLHYLNKQNLFLRYEDFVATPKDSIAQIMHVLDEPAPATLFDESDSVELGTHHTVAGNPDRFNRGSTKLRLDNEWKEKMNKRQKMLVTLLTWPLLLRYNYL